uniref:Serine/threonine-protein kinase Chk2 n=1 Tax=Timema monikensis TaxID=170555 RepID=A0A7R9DZP3_9NEOP|nr:unnamed protein product [Timema monikensis]
MRKDEYCVGREGCDLILPEKTANVSRKHFSVSRVDGRVVLKDWSLNGTYVNGTEVGKDRTVPLRHNDLIALVSPEMKNPLSPLGGFGERSFVAGKTRKKYALKYVEKDPEIEDSLMMEVKILQQLDHPFVIHFKELINTSDSLCILLEMMEGGDLYARIDPKNTLTEDTIKLIFFQTVSAVKYLHDQGITHRDLKPQNILLDSNKPNTLIKVTDFGVSKKETNMQTVIGTLFFIAPEILKQHFQQRTYTNQVDIWSLGVILFNCQARYRSYWLMQSLTGSACISSDLPFKNPAQTLMSNFSFDENPKWEETSPDVKDLISEMLIKDPADRITLDEIFRHPWLQLCLKVVCWGKKELLATSTNQRSQTCLIFEGRLTTQKRENDNAVSQNSPTASLVLTDSSQLTSDSQHRAQHTPSKKIPCTITPEPALREQQCSLYLAVPPSSPLPSYLRMRTTVKHHVAGTKESGKPFCNKIILSTPDRDLDLDLPVISSIVYCERSALDHAVTDAGDNTEEEKMLLLAAVLDDEENLGEHLLGVPAGQLRAVGLKNGARGGSKDEVKESKAELFKTKVEETTVRRLSSLLPRDGRSLGGSNSFLQTVPMDGVGGGGSLEA